MSFKLKDILETFYMFKLENVDIRTTTLGINLKDCADSDINKMADKIFNKIKLYAGNLGRVVDEVSEEYKIPIAHKRVSITPIANIIANCSLNNVVKIAEALDAAAEECNLDYIGGFSAYCQKGISCGEKILIDSIPEALSTTKRVCGSVNVASTKAGINISAIYRMAEVIKDLAFRTADQDGIGAAKLVIFANAPEDNPFMAGAFHGVSEPEATINVGISGPGFVRAAIENCGSDADLLEIFNTIKIASYKITRIGQLVLEEVSRRMNVVEGIIDLSLAPTPAKGDSIADIIKAIGVEDVGAHGSIFALALLNDAVKKGGAFASTFCGGLSGAFVPVLEDTGLGDAVQSGALTLSKLEAMTSVCSIGLDMIAVPGDISIEKIAGILADESAIGVINRKTTSVRMIPVPNKKAGDTVHFGGLLGGGPIMEISKFKTGKIFQKGGRIPAPLNSLTN